MMAITSLLNDQKNCDLTPIDDPNECVRIAKGMIQINLISFSRSKLKANEQFSLEITHFALCIFAGAPSGCDSGGRLLFTPTRFGLGRALFGHSRHPADHLRTLLLSTQTQVGEQGQS
jgi:hypothetical protein